MKLENINTVGASQVVIQEHVFECHESIRKVKKIANNALYFDDSSDYQTALYEILSELGETEEDLETLKLIK
jgi:hypothetical protein